MIDTTNVPAVTIFLKVYLGIYVIDSITMAFIVMQLVLFNLKIIWGSGPILAVLQY